MNGHRVLRPIKRLIPNTGTVSHGERLRASVGAMLGLLITGFVSRLALGASGDLPLLIAPMGASAVLLFAVPSSPLAQPWSILGGNIVAALIGITSARLVADPVAAAAVACACAIAAMLLLRCLHPPSGAVALTAVLGGPSIHAAGYGFALWPVGLNSALLLGAALLFNNATGRRYPHLVPPAPANGAPVPTTAVTRQDVGTVLRRHDEVVDVDRDDLLELVHEAQHLARSRGPTHGIAADVMTPAPATLMPGTDVEAALKSLTDGTHATMLVTDVDGLLVGSVSLAAVLRHLRPTRAGRRTARLFRRSMRFDLEPRRVGDVMQPAPPSIPPDANLDHVVATMIDGGFASVPVVDLSGKLLGIVEVSAMMALMSGRKQPVQPRSEIQRL